MDHKFVDWPIALQPDDSGLGQIVQCSIGVLHAIDVRSLGVLAHNVIVAPLEALFEVRTETSRHLIDANQLILAPTGATLQLTLASGQPNARCVIVALDAARMTQEWPTHIAIRRRPSATALCLQLALAELSRGDATRHNASQFVRTALGAPSMPLTQAPLINRALIALHRNGSARLSLARFADALYRESKHLTREFKRARGEPFYRYQMRLRLHHALGALTQGVAITEVALACGFSSHAHFSACFRACFGVSPSELRKLACGDAMRSLAEPSAVAAQAF